MNKKFNSKNILRSKCNFQGNLSLKRHLYTPSMAKEDWLIKHFSIMFILYIFMASKELPFYISTNFKGWNLIMTPKN